MRSKVLSVLVTAVALAACECAPDQSVNVGQTGAPGTPEDFKANIKRSGFLCIQQVSHY